MGHFILHIDKDHEKDFFDNLIINMVLFYPGGFCNVAFIPKEKRYVIGQNEIDKLLGRDQKINYPMLEDEPSKRY